jgi:hypothetical protein
LVSRSEPGEVGVRGYGTGTSVSRGSEAAPEGANGRGSTYLHLLVCLLEFDAVREVLGETTARATLGAFGYYTWVYREVLERPEAIRQILRTQGLDVPDARR